MKMRSKFIVGAMPLLLPLAACRKEDGKQPQAPQSVAPHGGMSAMGTPAKKESIVVVPEALKGKWKAVRIVVIEIASRKETTHAVPVGPEFKVPGTPLTLRVENLLPDFSMGGGVITSKSDRLDNPAAQVRVSEGGKEVFKGWMFTKFPEAHPFEHPRYALKVVELLP